MWKSLVVRGSSGCPENSTAVQQRHVSNIELEHADLVSKRFDPSTSAVRLVLFLMFAMIFVIGTITSSLTYHTPVVHDDFDSISNQRDDIKDRTESISRRLLSHVPESGALTRTMTTSLNYEIPEVYDGFKDISDSRGSGSEVPVFWHIPKSGGSTMKALLVSCYRLCIASDQNGIRGGHDQDTEIARVHGDTYVNVAVASSGGIIRAKQLGLAQSGLADVIVSPLIHELASIFDESHRGVVFTMFRHPVERFVSMYNYHDYATWEENRGHNLRGDISLEDYARLHLDGSSNWMVRIITNQRSGKLTRDHLQIAKEFIRKKVLVGLLSEIDESMERFEKFFDWKYYINPSNQEKCRVRLLRDGENTNAQRLLETPQPDSVVYKLVAAQFVLDIELYEYAETIFREQKQWFEGIPDNYRLVDAHCCKCTRKC